VCVMVPGLKVVLLAFLGIPIILAGFRHCTAQKPRKQVRALSIKMFSPQNELFWFVDESCSNNHHTGISRIFRFTKCRTGVIASREGRSGA